MKYEMDIRVEIRQTDHGSPYGGLHVSESLPFEAASFAELCGVLTRFHDLAEEIRRLRPRDPRP